MAVFGGRAGRRIGLMLIAIVCACCFWRRVERWFVMPIPDGLRTLAALLRRRGERWVDNGAFSGGLRTRPPVDQALAIRPRRRIFSANSRGIHHPP
jgi:hypothetical protein